MWLLGPVHDLSVPADAEPMLVAMLTGVDEVTRCALELLSVGEGDRSLAQGPGFRACRGVCPRSGGLTVRVLSEFLG